MWAKSGGAGGLGWPSIFSRPRRRTAFRGPAITRKNKTRDVSVYSSYSYTFADLQPKDIHGVTHTQSALSCPLRTRARAVPHVHRDAVLSSPHAHALPEHMRGLRRRLERDKLSLSPRAAYPCARGARSRKSCSRRLVVVTQHLNTKQGGSEVVSGGTCIASGRECVFSMCWCGRERPWRSTHRFPLEMVMLS